MSQGTGRHVRLPDRKERLLAFFTWTMVIITMMMISAEAALFVTGRVPFGHGRGWVLLDIAAGCAALACVLRIAARYYRRNTYLFGDDEWKEGPDKDYVRLITDKDSDDTARDSDQGGSRGEGQDAALPAIEAPRTTVAPALSYEAIFGAGEAPYSTYRDSLGDAQPKAEQTWPQVPGVRVPVAVPDDDCPYW